MRVSGYPYLRREQGSNQSLFAIETCTTGLAQGGRSVEQLHTTRFMVGVNIILLAGSRCVSAE